MARRFITVAEIPLFIRQASDVWDDAEREAFVEFIARNPEQGDLIPETGGVRKIRWVRPGSGKRGGARVIFYHNSKRSPDERSDIRDFPQTPHIAALMRATGHEP